MIEKKYSWYTARVYDANHTSEYISCYATSFADAYRKFREYYGREIEHMTWEHGFIDNRLPFIKI